MPVNISKNEITIENQYLKRIINTKNGIETKKYHIRPGGIKAETWQPMFSFEESTPFEAAVKLNGREYEAAPYKRSGENNNLWQRTGAYTFIEAKHKKEKCSDILDIILESRLPDMPETEIIINYEVYDNMPLLKKKVTVVNKGKEEFTVNNITVDILRFFDRRLALSTFTDYYCDVKKDDLYYFCWTRMEIPDQMDVVLAPGESVESFNLYEAVTSMDRQEESVILQRIYKQLAPWICNLRSNVCVNTCNSIEELFKVADEAQADGCELVYLHVGQVFTNTGDYIPRPDIFPGGYEDVKKMNEYFHKKGLLVLPYSSATIAWRDSQVCIDHPDWQCLGPDGIRYDPFGLGNMCYHSPWGEYIKEKLFYLIDEAGFDGLALDGPVHGLACLETNHAHKNANCVNFMNWEWEKYFYGEVAKRGKLITAPETWNAIFMGISGIPGGHREEDENEYGGMPLVVMYRACAYEARYTTPPSCHNYGVNIEPYHDHSIEASEEDTTTYEHMLGTTAGYGFNVGVFGKKFYIGEKTKAIYEKWMSMYRKNKDTLLGDFIHLAQPNGYEPDGVLHTNSKAEVPAIAVLFNPCKENKSLSLSLPLKYAGFTEGDVAAIEGDKVAVDSVGNAPYVFNFKAGEVKCILIKKVEK